MNLVWVTLITGGSVIAGTGLCFWLLYHAHGVDTTVWTLEHILCPVIRIVVLLIVVSQVYPAADGQSGSLDFWRVLAQSRQFSHAVNILFVLGLTLAFIPVLNHPVFALPVQSMLAIALVFHWQYRGIVDPLVLFPSFTTLLEIFAYMALAYFITREVSISLSRRIDQRFAIEGSIRLVSDAIYLSLQVPVMLIYCGFLNAQLS